MKRFRFVGIIGLLFIMLLTACSNQSDEASSEGKESETVTLTWYTVGAPQPDEDKVMEKVNEYVKEKINATIDLKMIDWGDYEQKMQVITASGENYDIAFTASYLNNYTLNARKGAFLAIDDLLEEHGKELKETLDPALLEGAKIDGKLYGVPANKEVGQQAVYVFNKEMLERNDLSIENVNSLEDLEPLLATIKENESGVTPLATSGASSLWRPFLPFDYIFNEQMPFAVRLDGNGEEVVNPYESEEMMESLKTMHEYYQKGYILKDAATSKETFPFEVDNWFVRKEGYQPYAELLWSRNAGYDVAVAPVHDPIVFNGSVTGSIQAISSTSKHPEKAMEFLNLLNTDPYLRNLMDKGIEGEHYEKLDNGKIKDLPARLDNYNISSYTLGNQFILDLYEEDPDDKWDAFKEFNASATNAPTLGFHFDTNPVRTEIASISNVMDEFAPALYTGSVDPEEYLPKANEKLKEAGIDKVMEEIQKQYDEWRAENQ
ncbi:ABC transporter substrate-binding protein [Sediminibacillus sp. JSM 1682029]|uniref:ABC transporter substrate-binding protein n=1 Tax=Sediminibacillus sp. JSM 1682029 TaxID=3229857 RepID=UPI0035258A11